MIMLQNLFSILAIGPYANTTFSDTNGTIKEQYYSKVATLTNLGIVEIYKRFKLLENELSLHIDPSVTNYYLRSNRVAPLANITTEQYIEEVTDVDGFLNIIKVTGAYDSSGTEIRLKTRSSIPTIMEVASDVLQITNIEIADTLSITYQSYPTKIISEDLDPEYYELNIPEYIVDPLVSYIAAKTFKPMGANDSTANADKSASYEQQYELACQKLLIYGLFVEDSTERDNFETKGWV
jgi:hypothetical protein